MGILPQVQPHSYEWQAMWWQLGQHPINQGLDNPKAATCPTTHNQWQYMDSGFYGPKNDRANIKHCFRHRYHPLTQQREYLHIPVTRSYLHTTFTPDQPNPSLLVEWVNALQTNFIPQLCYAYSNDSGANCVIGLLLNIAGLLKATSDSTGPAGYVDFERIRTIITAHGAAIDAYHLPDVISWLLALPFPAGYASFISTLQNLNDHPYSFPFIADYLLAQPFIKERYDQMIEPPPTSADPDAAFNTWMQQVDEAFIVRCGFTSADLDDQAYSDYYEDDMQPEEVVNLVLEELGYPGL